MSASSLLARTGQPRSRGDSTAQAAESQDANVATELAPSPSGSEQPHAAAAAAAGAQEGPFGGAIGQMKRTSDRGSSRPHTPSTGLVSDSYLLNSSSSTIGRPELCGCGRRLCAANGASGPPVASWRECDKLSGCARVPHLFGDHLGPHLADLAERKMVNSRGGAVGELWAGHKLAHKSPAQLNEWQGQRGPAANCCQSSLASMDEDDYAVPNDERCCCLKRSQVELVQLIGEGQKGYVFLGKLQSRDGSKMLDVAIKTLKYETEHLIERLMSEASMMRSLEHPHIIKFIGMCPETPALIAMELAKFGEIKQYLKLNRHLIKCSQLVLFAFQISTALSYLESKNFVHRDVAARNVLVCSPNCVKLADFGLSRSLLTANGAHTQSSPLPGHSTSSSSSPDHTLAAKLAAKLTNKLEQASGHQDDQDQDQAQTYVAAPRVKLPVRWLAPESLVFRRFSSASDVWMFAVCVWELFHWGQQRPWPQLRNHQVLAAISAGQRLARPPACPARLYQLMLQCWSYAPVQRPKFREIKQSVWSIYLSERTREQLHLERLEREHQLLLMSASPQPRGAHLAGQLVGQMPTDQHDYYLPHQDEEEELKLARGRPREAASQWPAAEGQQEGRLEMSPAARARQVALQAAGRRFEGALGRRPRAHTDGPAAQEGAEVEAEGAPLNGQQLARRLQKQRSQGAIVLPSEQLRRRHAGESAAAAARGQHARLQQSRPETACSPPAGRPFGEAAARAAHNAWRLSQPLQRNKSMHDYLAPPERPSPYRGGRAAGARWLEKDEEEEEGGSPEEEEGRQDGSDDYSSAQSASYVQPDVGQLVGARDKLANNRQQRRPHHHWPSGGRLNGAGLQMGPQAAATQAQRPLQQQQRFVSISPALTQTSESGSARPPSSAYDGLAAAAAAPVQQAAPLALGQQLARLAPYQRQPLAGHHQPGWLQRHSDEQEVAGPRLADHNEQHRHHHNGRLGSRDTPSSGTPALMGVRDSRASDARAPTSPSSLSPRPSSALGPAAHQGAWLGQRVGAAPGHEPERLAAEAASLVGPPLLRAATGRVQPQQATHELGQVLQALRLTPMKARLRSPPAQSVRVLAPSQRQQSPSSEQPRGDEDNLKALRMSQNGPNNRNYNNNNNSHQNATNGQQFAQKASQNATLNATLNAPSKTSESSLEQQVQLHRRLLGRIRAPTSAEGEPVLGARAKPTGGPPTDSGLEASEPDGSGQEGAGRGARRRGDQRLAWQRSVETVEQSLQLLNSVISGPQFSAAISGEPPAAKQRQQQARPAHERRVLGER